MTAPDDGLERALRQALSSAADQVEPGDGGLERILVRTGGKPPRPWLASVTVEALWRLRNWTGRGHWAWQAPGFWSSDAGRPMLVKAAKVAWTIRLAGADVLGQLADGLRRLGLASRSSAAAPRGLRWARLAAGLAAAAFVTAVAVTVPPLRAALVQVSSTVLTGGNEALPPGTGGAGGPGGPNGTGYRSTATAAANGGHDVSPSGSPGSRRAGSAPGAPGVAGASQLPCATPSTGSGGSAGGPTASPSAVQASLNPVPVPSASPHLPTPSTSGECPATTGQPTPPPATSGPATPAPAVTTAPVEGPPTTVPPSSAAPAPTDSPTPPPSPTPGTGPSGSASNGGASSGTGSSGTGSSGISGIAPAN